MCVKSAYCCNTQNLFGNNKGNCKVIYVIDVFVYMQGNGDRTEFTFSCEALGALKAFVCLLNKQQRA